MVEEAGSNQLLDWQILVVTRRGEYPAAVTEQQEMASVAPRFRPGVTKPEHFLAQLKAYGKSTKKEDADLLQEVCCHLEGQALDWHASLPEATQKDVKLFKEAFLNQYSTATDTFTMMARLKARRQMPGEDPVSFVDELTVLCTDCKLPEQLAVPLVIEGLQPSLQQTVRVTQPKSLADVRKAVKMFPAQHSIPENSALEAMQKQLTSIQDRLASISSVQRSSGKPNTAARGQYRTQQRPRDTCGRCGGRSHPKIYCKAIGKRCNKCHKMDHFAHMCRSKSE